MDTIQKLGNRIARQHGYGRATKILIGSQDAVLHHTKYGYRKTTTGEYVPNAYRRNFGWKNTYYQQAETIVVVGLEQG